MKLCEIEDKDWILGCLTIELRRKKTGFFYFFG